MSCLIPPPQLSIRLLPILPKLSINNPAFWGKFRKIEQFYKEFWHGTFANRKLRLAVLLYILRRKRHRSIQCKRLYFNMDVKCITKHQYSSDLWPLKIKRNCIVRQIARSTFCWQITRSTFHSVFVLNAAIRIKIPLFDSELEIVLITDVNCITNSILAIYGLCLWKPSEIALLTKSLKII
jgi:hypothetical protein